MSKKIFNAYYSAKADAIFGHCLYRLTTGEVTQVCALYEVGQPQSFGWDDAVLVGQVQEGGLVRGCNKTFKFITDDNKIQLIKQEKKEKNIIQNYLMELDPDLYLKCFNVISFTRK